MVIPVQEVQLHGFHLHLGDLPCYMSQNLNLHCRENNWKNERTYAAADCKGSQLI